jgi:tetratricopeptide (TPR) repeat protein
MTTAILFIFIALLGVSALKIFTKPSGKHSEKPNKSEDPSGGLSLPGTQTKPGVNLKLLQSQGVKSLQEAGLHQLPPPPEPYIGRQSEAKNLLKEEFGRPIIINIHGPQGIGKKALALKTAQKLFFQFRDAQIFYDMKSNGKEPRGVAQALAHIIQLFNPNVDIPENKIELVKLYRMSTKGQRIILILGNVSSEKQAKPLLLHKNSVVILTSAEPLNLPRCITQGLEEMEKQDALDLITALCPRAGFSNIEISKTCRNHPFSIVLTSKFLTCNPDINPPDFIKALQSQISSMEITGSMGFQKIQLAVISTCYKFLPVPMSSSLRKMAIIPGSFDDKAQGFICEDSEGKFLAHLHLMGFLEYEEKSDRYTMPDQIRTFLRKQIQVGEKSLTTTRFSAYYLTRLVAAHESFSSGDQGIIKGMMTFDQEWDNINLGQSWSATHVLESEDSARICSSYMESAAELLNKRQPLSVAISWYEAALQAAQKMGDTQAEKTHLLNLAEQLTTQKKHERASQLLTKCLELAKQLGDAKTELAVHHQLGRAAMDMKKYEKAVEHFEQERDYVNAMEDKPGLEEILEYLGECQHLMGNTSEALKLYGTGLTQAQKAKNFLVQSRIFRKIGQTHNENKNGQAAIRFLEQGLIVARKNKHKVEQGLILSQLGESYNQTKSLEKALGNYKQAVLMAQQTNNMLMEGEATWKLSILLKQKGESSGAIQHGKSAIKIFGALNHPLKTEAHKKVQEWRMSEGEVI